MPADTIFALSSGLPPAGIAVIRVSGPDAASALASLVGTLPKSRRATLRQLRDARGEMLDQALVLWLPRPHTATGEDSAELHLHGGRAVVAAVEAALGELAGLRRAQPGEFTRRAFANGRIDLAEAEGLADLLAAETELQRRSAQALAGGQLSRQVSGWRGEVLRLSAMIEATLDFSDEGEVGDALPQGFAAMAAALGRSIGALLDRPRAEPLREGIRVVIAGPPNAGKSTLFNALTGAEHAITSPEAGTTRDVLRAPIAIDGVPFHLIDTAGLRDDGAGTIEAIGIDRARAETESADLVLWLGPEGQGPRAEALWEVAAQSDRPDATVKSRAIKVSALTGEGVDDLRLRLARFGRDVLPKPGELAINQRQSDQIAICAAAMRDAAVEADPLLVAEALRQARAALDALTGHAGTEAMLDTLFGRFCIGK